MKKLAIDIGGTTVKGALFDGREIVSECAEPTPAREGQGSIFATVFRVIRTLGTEGVERIGVSSAGNIDPRTGECMYATENLVGWTGARIRTVLEGRFSIPVQVDNDAICALKGELSVRGNVENVTMLTFGTGLGGASRINGKIVRGAFFDAARWGHLVLVPGGRKCNCGKRGCAERYLSATALVKQGKKRMLGLSTCEQLFRRYEAGENEAQEVLLEFGYYLNALLDDIRTAIAPELILFGGAVAQSEKVFRELIKKQDDIEFAKLGKRAGLYGAIAEGIE